MGMPYKVPVNGIEVACDTAEEAMALTKLAAAQEARHKNVVEALVNRSPFGLEKIPRTVLIPSRTWGDIHPDARKLAALLVNSAGTESIDGALLAKSLEVEGIQGLGPKLRTQKRLLDNVGIDLDAILVRIPVIGGPSLWSIKRGPELDKLIKLKETAP